MHGVLLSRKLFILATAKFLDQGQAVGAVRQCQFWHIQMFICSMHLLSTRMGL